LTAIPIENEDKLEDLLIIYNKNFIGNYILNEYFSEKSKLNLESENYEKSLFLKDNSTLNIMVISAVLMERQERMNKYDALESYFALFSLSKNSQTKIHKI
jgi:hypothetical protein